MRLSDLNLNLLVYLDALLEEKNVSKAADRVSITQSAMSLALARLREYFQDDILRQVGKTMVPTSLALSMAQPVHDVLIQIRSILSSADHFDPTKSDRKITISGSDFTMDLLLKKTLPLTAQIAPGIRIDYQAISRHCLENFEQGRTDFIISPEVSMIEGHPGEHLFNADFTCVVWSGNTLVGDQISFAQYKQLGHVIVKLGEGAVPTYEQWFMRRYGEVRRIEVEVPTFTSAVQLVSGTQRIALCHRKHAEMYAQQYSLKLIAPPFDIPPSKLYLQWHKYMDRDPVVKWFRGLLKTALKDQ